MSARRVARALGASLVGLGLALAVLPAAPASAGGDDDLAVFVVVVDGLMPEEIDATMPTLSAFRDASVRWEESRSVMIAETIPNHVAMMTGVFPDRSGIPSNRFWDRDESAPEERDMDDPALLLAETLWTRLEAECAPIATSTIMSKEYLHLIFRGGGVNTEADFHWEPGPLIPVSEHTPDPNTMSQVLPRVATDDFMFVNLGDVDRAGHTDGSGGVFSIPDDLLAGPFTDFDAFRDAVRVSTDQQLALFFDELESTGRWDSSVVFVVSDHGIDYSPPLGFIDVMPVLDGVETGRFQRAQNGGADSIYLRNTGQPDDDADLKAGRDAILAAFPTEIAHAWYRQPNPADPGGEVAPPEYHLGTPNAGDLILIANDGWRFSSVDRDGNPIPGNHGHLVTRHNTFIIGGGHPIVADPASIAAPGDDHAVDFANQSRNVDVAPTVAWLFGLSTDDYDGRVLTEAFDTGAEPPAVCARSAVAPTPTAPGSTVGAVSAGGEALPATGSAAPLALAAALVAVGLVLSVARARAD